jgi:iron complex transport system substrate-binding protein
MIKIFLTLLLVGQTLYGKPLRIISLSPALTEIIFALGFGDTLVGVSDFSDFPPAAKKIISVGAYSQPNIEKIIALKPDLVFIPLEGPDDVKKRLEQFKLSYSVISMRKLHEIGLAAEKISENLESPQVGINFKRKWDQQIAKAFRGNHHGSKVVFIEVQKDPLIAAGKETFLDEIVSGCGGNNLVIEKNYPKLSLEITVSKSIDVVLLADYFSSPLEKEAAIKWWKERPHPPKKIAALDVDTTARPGPRLLEGINSICKILR